MVKSWMDVSDRFYLLYLDQLQIWGSPGPSMKRWDDSVELYITPKPEPVER